MIKKLSIITTSVLLLSSCNITTSDEGADAALKQTNTNTALNITTDTHIGTGTNTSESTDVNTQWLTDDETGTFIGRIYECQWEFIDTMTDIFRIELDNIEHCEEDALSVIPTIDFGDGSQPIRFTQDYITHKFEGGRSYSIKIYSGSEFVEDIEFQKIVSGADLHATNIGWCWGPDDSNVNIVVEQIDGVSPNPSIVNIDSSDFFCEDSVSTFHIYDASYRTYELDFGDASEPLELELGFYNHIYPIEGEYTASLSTGKSLTFDVSHAVDQVIQNNCTQTTPLISIVQLPSTPHSIYFRALFEAQVQIVTKDGCTYWDESDVIWDFGDGASRASTGFATGIKVGHFYRTAGIYPVSVKGDSQYANVSRTILIDTNKQTSITDNCELIPSTPYLRFNTQMIASNTVEIDSSLLTFPIYNPCDTDVTSIIPKWDFGDGQSILSSNLILSHQYSELGEYIISVTFGYKEDNITITKNIVIE
ncbi:MAG: hypothetical protein HRU38_12270 [Saccharospirillaceae bacterium]|nr:PKD domain-containing protein [Pseudomonadales bacterium]NRB79423.1 hypothetical protein [Saccharospirillaceae bacterium]